MTEYRYNTSFQASLRITPHEVLYEIKPVHMIWYGDSSSSESINLKRTSFAATERYSSEGSA